VFLQTFDFFCVPNGGVVEREADVCAVLWMSMVKANHRPLVQRWLLLYVVVVVVVSSFLWNCVNVLVFGC
jgi:hypothetical protein